MFSAPPRPKHGLTPPGLDDANHYQRCLAQLRSKDKNIEKYIYLSALKNEDPHMFYRLALLHMPEITPLIYTPTVGDACLQFSHIYRRPEGMVRNLKIFIRAKSHFRFVFSSYPSKTRARFGMVRLKPFQFFSVLPIKLIPTVIHNWPKIDEARISVVTDGGEPFTPGGFTITNQSE